METLFSDGEEIEEERQGDKGSGRQGDRKTGSSSSLSPCPLVPLSPCPLVPLSPCPLVPLSPCLLLFRPGGVQPQQHELGDKQRQGHNRSVRRPVSPIARKPIFHRPESEVSDVDVRVRAGVGQEPRDLLEDHEIDERRDPTPPLRAHPPNRHYRHNEPAQMGKDPNRCDLPAPHHFYNPRWHAQNQP